MLRSTVFPPKELNPIQLMLYRAFHGGGDEALNYITKLYAYGGCEQNGTPTPSAPVDIVCNNGALRMVDDELPSGYRRLLGITFDGGFRYETGEALTGDDDVTMTLDNTTATGRNVFGSYNGASKNNFSMYLYGGGSASNCYFRYGTQLKRPNFGDGKRTITFGKGGTEGFETDVEVTQEEFTTPTNVYIGMLPNSSSPAYVGDIVGNVRVSNRLEWIPCENPGGVIGYYEKFNGNFIAPTGDGTPVSLGYDYSHTSLSVVGTPEVITVSRGLSTRTATVENLFGVGNYKDEQEIISGVVTRRVGVCVYDGTQSIGDIYLSTTGGKDVGAIIVYPLAEAITETVTAQPVRGTSAEITQASIDDLEISVITS